MMIKRAGRRCRRAALWGCCSLLLLCCLCSCSRGGSTADGEETARPVETVQAVYREVTITTQLNGRVQPFDYAEIRPQVSGIIQQRCFAEGATVKAGDVLYLIDDRTYQANLASAEAALLQQQARLSITEHRLKRARDLFARDAGSRQDVEEAELNFEEARADLAAAQAEVDRCRVDLSYTRVTSPIDGTVGKTDVSTGSLVSAEQSEPLTVVRQLDRVYVDLQQSARQWRRLKTSVLFGELTTDRQTENVVLFNDDGSEFPETGKLILAEPAVDEGSGSVTLRAIFDNKYHLLLPGMAVRAKFIGAVNPHSLVIPARAVERDPKGQTFVYVVTREKRAQRRQVSLGVLSPAGYEVLSGLDGGDEVVISGLSALRDGALVDVQNKAPQS